MTDTIQVIGTFDGLTQGYVVFEDLPYVLTVSRAYLNQGWPEWSYRYTHPMDLQYWATLDNWNLGTAEIYNGNPAPFAVPAGKFDVGNAGVVRALLNEYLGTFEDFAVFADGDADPATEGWIHPASPVSVTAPVGTMQTAWHEASALVFPPKDARYVVPVVNVSSLPASGSVYLDAFDVRVVPATSDPTVMPQYESPRSLHVRVKPTRLNYAAGSTDLTDLTPGTVYTASADVAGTRESFQFTPATSTYTLEFSDENPTRILVETGTTLGDYFDGSFGADYLWELGGNPWESRSYYYQDRGARNYILTRLLQENTPMGMKVAQPQYAVFSG